MHDIVGMHSGGAVQQGHRKTGAIFACGAVQQYGLVRDGTWRQVSIPFGAFHDLDLQSVKQMFMLAADPPGANVDFAIDNVYFQSP